MFLTSSIDWTIKLWSLKENEYDIIDQHALKPPISKFEHIAAKGFRKPHSAFLWMKTNEIIFTSKPWSPQI
ncbi:hypothetical protein NQ317_015156 [Molorchus minor]|uniref:Uncharacterized protein n=1 Tax=Molorchus minor TaxID=1323400 RepID=A0ABQ9K4X9_9CUCU|nr:hypothetical protein NQ317_015156 [Molorchus minor]